MTATTRGPGWHPVGIAHLVLGLALLGSAVVCLLYAGDVVGGHALRWLVAVPWVLAGAAGLVAAAASGGRRHAVRQQGWLSAAPPADPTTPRPSDPPHPTQEQR